MSSTHSDCEKNQRLYRALGVSTGSEGVARGAAIANDFQTRQLSLFLPFLCNNETQRQKLSNSIEFWDSVPRYSISRQAMIKMRDKNGNLPLLELEFEYRQERFSVSIQATQIKGKDKEGKPVTLAYYPSASEELVEEALRKLAVDQEQGFYINEKPAPKSGVSFSLYQLREELKRIGHSRSFEEIKLSLNILSRSSIQIVSTTQKTRTFAYSTYLPVVAGVGRSDIENDPNAKWIVHFHPLVTDSIEKLSYRQFNYDQLMSHTTQLTRWLHKQLIQKYIAASITNPFEMYYSTIKRDSAMLENYSRERKAHEACDLAMKELVKNRVLVKYNLVMKTGLRGKVLDVVYTLIPSPDFVSEVKAANSRKKLSTR